MVQKRKAWGAAGSICLFIGGEVLLATAAAPVAQAQQRAATVNFNIQPQPLATALLEFSKQAGLQVLTNSQVVGALNVQGVQGVMAPAAAIARLLSGTNLTYRFVGADAIAIEARATTSATQTPETARLARAAGESSAVQATAVPVLEEVTVTAQKRAERLSEVPASVSAVTGEELTRIGAGRLQDYVALVPGLHVADQSVTNGSVLLSIRGITTGSGNPTVGIYIDDSPFGASNLYGTTIVPDLDPMDLARVEVLRGPQGTLYGAGSMGGLLKYVTAVPDPSRLFGRVEVDGSAVSAGGNGYGVRGAVNLPLSDTLALRVSAYDRHDPGYIDNPITGRTDVNNSHSDGGRAALGWAVNDSWKLTLSALFQRQASSSDSGVDYDPNSFEPLYGALQQVRAPGTSQTTQQVGSYDLHLDGELGWATLISATSYSSARAHWNTDYSPLFGPIIAAVYSQEGVGAAVLEDTHVDKISQEVRLSSSGPGVLGWQAGVFYTHERATDPNTIHAIDPITGSAAPLGAIALIDSADTFEEFAGFGDVTWRIAPRWDVTGGLRYSYNQQSSTETTSGSLEGPLATVDGHSNDSSVTYLLTPRFHLDDRTMVYLRWATGYRPGGPNLAVSGVPSSFGPDKVTNYEAGLKSSLLERRLSVEFAVFYIDWKNIQVFESTSEGLGYYGNAGGATSKGFELSGSWLPLQGLAVGGNVSRTNAVLTTDLPASGGAVGAKGDELPNTSRWTGELSADYDLLMSGDWHGLAGASYRYVGETAGYFPAPGTPRFAHPAYDVVDLRAGVTRKEWTIMAYVKNVGDSHGQSSENALGPVTRVSIIPPRTFGLSIARTF